MANREPLRPRLLGRQRRRLRSPSCSSAARGFPNLKSTPSSKALVGANIDPAPHIQPIASALASARVVCSHGDVKPSLAAVLDVDVSGKLVHASSRNSTGVCLARAIDGKPIEDATSFHVELLVSAS